MKGIKKETQEGRNVKARKRERKSDGHFQGIIMTFSSRWYKSV